VAETHARNFEILDNARTPGEMKKALFNNLLSGNGKSWLRSKKDRQLVAKLGATVTHFMPTASRHVPPQRALRFPDPPLPPCVR
jgi:hypothetical protein